MSSQCAWQSLQHNAGKEKGPNEKTRIDRSSDAEPGVERVRIQWYDRVNKTGLD